MSPRRASLPFVTAMLWPALVTGTEGSVSPPGLVIEAGSVARQQVVALGRGLEVHGEALSDVAAVRGSVDVTGTVGGSVIVLGGDVRLAPSAQVDGDVFVLGGRIEAGEGAAIGGRSVAYPSIGSAWLILLEGPSLGLPAFSGVVISAKLALLAAWLAWSLFVFAISGREVLSTSDAVGREPFRNFFVGLAGVFVLFFTALLLSALASAIVGLPLLFLVVLIAILLKLWGMVAVFHALGWWIARKLATRRWMPLNCAMLGLLILGGLKLLPWVGVWTWTMASLIGIGAAADD